MNRRDLVRHALIGIAALFGGRAVASAAKLVPSAPEQPVKHIATIAMELDTDGAPGVYTTIGELGPMDEAEMRFWARESERRATVTYAFVKDQPEQYRFRLRGGE